MGSFPFERVPVERIELRFCGRKIEAQLAKGMAEKAWGLRMREDGRMLFPFSIPKRPAIDSFMVPEKLFLYFLDSEGEVIETGELAPRRIYRPESSASYLLESFDDLGLEEGDKVEFQL